MGQYYKPVSLDKKEYLCANDYNNGLKLLMEHSWIGNGFMNEIMNLISPGGAWHKTHIVWAGDYADPVDGETQNVYDLCDGYKKITPRTARSKNNMKFLVKHSKKLFLPMPKYKKDIWQRHPLSLLTCEGNGRGGGYYRRDENEFIGTWRGDIISAEMEVPDGFQLYPAIFPEY